MAQRLFHFSDCINLKGVSEQVIINLFNFYQSAPYHSSHSHFMSLRFVFSDYQFHLMCMNEGKGKVCLVSWFSMSEQHTGKGIRSYMERHSGYVDTIIPTACRR